MGDENRIRTLRDHSRPSHEGYRNTIELPDGNNVVPLRSNTIRLVQKGCSFHGLRSEDPNQHLKDFLKLVDSLDLDVANRERTCLQSISTWEDLTTRFLAQFFPPGRTVKLRNEIFMFQQHQENLALYDHENWNDSRDFFKPVKAVSLPPNTSKTLDRRLLELEDQIKFLLKGSKKAPVTNPTHIPEAYADAVSSDPHPRNPNGPPRQNSFTFQKCVCPDPQPQALETSFEARVRDYMAAHTERMERFENAIFKQREEINDRMTEMFELLKELTTSRTPEKVLVREEARHPITKHINFVSLIRMEQEKRVGNDGVVGKNIVEPNNSNVAETLEEVDRDDEAKNRSNKESVRSTEKDLMGEKFNDSLLAMKSGKMGCEAYHLLPAEPMCKAMLKKMITKKEDMEGNFVIPCNVGRLKYMNALIDQGSDVNVMPLSTYNRLTNKKLVETNIRLSLSSQSHIQPLGIAEDVLVEIAGFIYPVDFVILDIKEDKRKPFILGTTFLKMAKAEIRFDKGTITLKFGKSKTNFCKILEFLCKFEEIEKDEFDLVTPASIISKLISEWEERINSTKKRKWSLTNGEARCLTMDVPYT
ncbi:MAK10-like protein [Tanacetum coccineum]